jgi:hypothetical protein
MDALQQGHDRPGHFLGRRLYFGFRCRSVVEAKITDSVSGDLLGAVADKRIGGGSVTTGFQWQWGDAENVIDDWCEKTAEHLSAWATGAENP